jgi:predicted AAA+ superfamily ATPase
LFSSGRGSKKIARNPQLKGNILENFVISELQKQMAWNRTRTKLFFMRTAKGEEVDILSPCAVKPGPSRPGWKAQNRVLNF